MKAWLAQHARCAGLTLTKLARTPLGSALNIVVIGIALSLPVGLYLLIDNLQTASGQLAAEPQISAFLALDASRAEIAQIETRLKQNPRVLRFRFVPRAEALQELKQSSGLADVIDSLPQNPLPDAFIVTAKDNAPQALDALRDEIKQLPRVVHAQLDAAWARRLDATLRFGRLVVLFLGGLLAVALIAVTFNTIRLQVLTQRDEVEVVKLIGATDAFIRRPFLYYGALQGAAGGLVAWLIVSSGVWLVNHNLGELSHVYASLFQLIALTPADSLCLLLLPAALGWFGALLSVGRHLAVIEP
ncbi:MAG: permease-like cell division protein FtsX [Proteobacteria bacterium]|nr:permease-like cell division protein FtsX [Pseudomonadota bacterium]